jgi:predicted secreted hydrolase
MVVRDRRAGFAQARHRFSAHLLPQPAGRAETLRSPLAARQILFAHAALTIPGERLRHAERAARANLGASFSSLDLDVSIGAWRMVRQQNASGEVLRLQMQSPQFSFDLTLTPSQPLLLQGDQGYSRKGHGPELASYYVSWPQLQVGGTLLRDGRRQAVSGQAWFDHEWSTDTAWRPRRRLGLAGHQPHRRRRADGVPHARCRRRNALRARRLA